jgi:4-amino-4-deoxy-L-arabinose transferase-like glycosyltransferase
MARSNDWVTPRLWGEPWFEKPALLYWMSGLGFRAGLGAELAPRLPVALLGVGFLAFYYLLLRRRFGGRAAVFATVILGTSTGWLAFSHVGVTDLPVTAFFSAAMLLCLPWVAGAGRANLTAAGALLGLAVLAKGLVPLVLALPLAWMGRRRLRDWLRPAPVAAFLLAAAPWYILCTLAHGFPFLDDFFLRHHLERYASDALRHEQPFWFYAPVLLAGLFPWTPLIALLFRKSLFRDPERRFLLLWVVFGLLFFSASLNKLPGYLLPLFPALAALVGIALAEARRAHWQLAGCAALFGLLPVIASVLPDALLMGLSRASTSLASAWPAFLFVPLTALVWRLEKKGLRERALWLGAAALTCAVVWLKIVTFPVLDRTVSARVFWRGISHAASELCVERVNRGWRYNLNYYSGNPLPDCAASPRRLRIREGTGGRPVVEGR